MNAAQDSSEANDHMMQQSVAMGEPASISFSRPLAPPDAINNNSGNNAQQLQLQPPPNTTLSMTFPALGSPGDQFPPPPPPPRCQIVNPFLGSPPLASHGASHDRLPPQPVSLLGGSSLGGQMDSSAFGSQDMRHRGYLGIMNLPPPFQVQIPNLQSQVQAFQQDMVPQASQHGLMPQQQQQPPPPPPPGFLQGYMATEIVPASNDSRSSQLLQPQVRQRARRRSRANRAASIQQHAQEMAVTAANMGGTNGGGGGVEAPAGEVATATVIVRPREMPTAPLTVDSTFGDMDGESVGPTIGGLDDAKLEGLEESYCTIGENFECNICFQKANEAVVTCCGHLFCWPCLYRWLHIHSYHKECPVCKGAIDESNITPIYGRECSTLLSARGLPGGSAAERIPPRPPARRVESARQLREREDRVREREQRERAIEREREREREQQQQSEARALQQRQAEAFATQGDNAAAIAVVATLAAADRPVTVGITGERESTASSTVAIQSAEIHSAGREMGAGGGAGGQEAVGHLTISSTSGSQPRQEEVDSMVSEAHEGVSDGIEPTSSHQTVAPPGVNNIASFSAEGAREGGRRYTTLSTDPDLDTGGYLNVAGSGRLFTPSQQLQGLVPRTMQVVSGPNNHGSTTASRGEGGPTFPPNQRQVSERREQLRAALAASAQSGSGALNSIPSSADRVEERRQMMAAAALLSREWEDVVNISRRVGPVNPSQAAAWMAAVQGHLDCMERPSVDALGNSGGGSAFQSPSQQQREGGGSHSIHRFNSGAAPVLRPTPRHMISHVHHGGSGGGGGGGDDGSLRNLVAVNPVRAGTWLDNMRSRLTSMEKIVENGGSSPLQVLQPHHYHHGAAAVATAAATHVNQNLHIPSAQSSTLPFERVEGCHLQQPTPRARASNLVELDLLNLSQQQQQPISVSNSSTTTRSNSSMEGRPSSARASAAAAAGTLLGSSNINERKRAPARGVPASHLPPGAAATPLASSSTSTSTSTSSAPSSSCPARTVAEPRLQYCEVPPMQQRPPHCSSNSRRRYTSRTAGAGAGSGGSEESSASIDSSIQQGGQTGAATRCRHDDPLVEGSGCSTAGNPEAMSVKSKRRRLD